VASGSNVLEVVFQSQGSKVVVDEMQRIKGATDGMATAFPRAAAGFGAMQTRATAMGNAMAVSAGQQRAQLAEAARAAAIMESFRSRFNLPLLPGQQIGAQLGGVQAAFAGIRSAATSLVAPLGLVSAGFAVVASSVYVAVRALKPYIDAANEAEDASVRLGVALSSTGEFSRGAVSGINSFAAALARATGIDDEEIVRLTATLAQVGRLGGASLERAARAAIDLSQVLGRDTASAALLLARAAEGSTQMLSRYGITVDEAASKSEKFAQALTQIEAKFGGTAAALGNTFGGSINKLAVEAENFRESIGGIVVPVLRPAIDAIAAGFRIATLFVQFHKGAIDELPAAIGKYDTAVQRSQSFGLLAFQRAIDQGLALKRFLESPAATAEITMTVAGGPIQEAIAQVEAFEALAQRAQARIDALRDEQASPQISTPDIRFALIAFDKIDARAKELRQQLNLRIVADEREAVASIKAALDASSGLSTLEARIRLVAEDIRGDATRARAQWVDAFGFFNVPFVVNAKDIADTLLPLKRAVEVPIEQRIKAVVDTGDAAKIEVLFKSLEERRASLEFRDTDIARRELEQVNADLLLMNKLTSGKLDITVDAATLDKVSQISQRLRDSAAGETISLFDPRDLAVGTSLASSLDTIRASLQIAFKSDSTEAFRARLLEVRESLSTVAAESQQARPKIESFLSSLDKQFVLDLQAKIDNAKIKAEVDQTKEIIQSALQTAPSSVRLFDFSAAVREANSVAQLSALVKSSLAGAFETPSSANEAVAIFTGIDSILERIPENARAASGEMIAALQAVRDSAAKAYPELKALDDISRTEHRFQLLVRLERFAEARADLAELEAESAKYPKNLDLRVRVLNAREELEAAEEAARAAADRMGATFAKFGAEVKATVADSIGQTFAAAFRSAVDSTQSFADNVKAIMFQMLDALIAKYVALIAVELVAAILSGGATLAPGIGGGIPLGGGRVGGKPGREPEPPPPGAGPPLPRLRVLPPALAAASALQAAQVARDQQSIALVIQRALAAQRPAEPAARPAAAGSTTAVSLTGSPRRELIVLQQPFPISTLRAALRPALESPVGAAAVPVRSFVIPSGLRPQETDGFRLRRAVRGPGEEQRGDVVHANINTLDSADFERYISSGRGAQALRAISRRRRGR